MESVTAGLIGQVSVMVFAHTLYNVILRIGRSLLETRENIIILTRPFYHIDLDAF